MYNDLEQLSVNNSLFNVAIKINGRNHFPSTEKSFWGGKLTEKTYLIKSAPVMEYLSMKWLSNYAWHQQLFFIIICQPLCFLLAECSDTSTEVWKVTASFMIASASDFILPKLQIIKCKLLKILITFERCKTSDASHSSLSKCRHAWTSKAASTTSFRCHCSTQGFDKYTGTV